MKKLFGYAVLATALTIPAFAGNLTLLSSPGTVIDSTNWSGLGGDQASFFSGATTNSAGSNLTTIGVGTLGGIISVVCPAVNPSSCSWGHQSSGYGDGDSLLLAEGQDANSNPVGTGPISLSLANAVGGLGAYLQLTASGAFSATLTLFNGQNQLGFQSLDSDVAGDPLFLGMQDTVSEITRAVFTVTACSSFQCDAQDFSLDTLQIYDVTTATPEPATFALSAGLLALGFGLRSRLSRRKNLMKKVFICSLGLAGLALSALAQDDVVIDASLIGSNPASRTTLRSLAAQRDALRIDPVISVVTPALPLWQYQVVSPRDGNTYQGAIVGGNPFNRGARTTNINVVLIPLRIVLTSAVSPRAFDPLSPDAGCLGAGNTPKSLTDQSPMFNTVPNYIMNGVNLGTVTYPDAFQRAEFWSSIGTVAPAYHLGLTVTTAAEQTITAVNGSNVGLSATFNGHPDCSTNALTADNPPRYAIMDINFIDAQLNTIIANLTAANVLNANKFPLFMPYRLAMTDGDPHSAGCCINGYHSTVTNVVNPAAPGQTYGIAGYDPGLVFQKDLPIISHEFMEWVNDPSGINPTPEWGNIGQVGGCVVTGNTHTAGQNNFETGDPLSGTLNPGVLMPNGVTYRPQEQAFYSWYYGGPSLGAGGKYSSNGTFGGFAKSCAAGGGSN